MAFGVTGAVLVLVASASAPSDLWTNPERSTSDVSRGDGGGGGPSARSGGGGWEWPGWLATVLDVVTTVVFVAIAGAALAAALGLVRDRSLSLFGRRFSLPGRSGIGDRLPSSTVTIDAASARAALLEGRPRNAIVACWVELERDAAAAGVPRLEAETSAEYAARVVRHAIGDPGPIDALAALYREARFSQHELTDAHRAQAMQALEAVLAALAEPARVPA